jgi:DNA-binding MarR family transcriptional regulator
MSDFGYDELDSGLVPGQVPAALADQTGYLLRLGSLRAGEVGTEVMPPGTTVRFYGVLATLTELGPHSQHELSTLLHVNRTMMVKLIDAMEQAGLVERRRNPTDRRSYALEATEAGRNMLKQMAAAADRGEQALTGELSGGERERLQHLLQKVVVAGEENPEIPAGLSRRTGYLISIAHLRVREWFAELLKDTAIAPPDFGALVTIADSGPISQQQVADRLGFTGTAVLQIVDRLEADGLVERRRNPVDRRAYALELTPTGRVALRRVQNAIAQLNGQLSDVVGGTTEERELHGLLRKLLAV